MTYEIPGTSVPLKHLEKVAFCSQFRCVVASLGFYEHRPYVGPCDYWGEGCSSLILDLCVYVYVYNSEALVSLLPLGFSFTETFKNANSLFLHDSMVNLTFSRMLLTPYLRVFYIGKVIYHRHIPFKVLSEPLIVQSFPRRALRLQQEIQKCM